MPIIALKAFTDNYIWAIYNDTTINVIDPGEAQPVIEYAKKNNLKLSNILLTHHHFDHTGGLTDLIKAFPDVVIYGPNDNRIEKLNVKVEPNTIIKIQEYNFKILFTPGHTVSHVCYYEANKNWLFSGDTLFSAGCGRLFEGTITQLYDSLMLLRDLPDTTKVFAGHEYTRQNLKFALTIEPENTTMLAHLNFLEQDKNLCSLPSTIALEKEINPFLRTDKKLQYLNNLRDPLTIFKSLREMKDNFVG